MKYLKVNVRCLLQGQKNSTPQKTFYTKISANIISICRFVKHISIDSYQDIDWNSFVTEKTVTAYINQIPEGGTFKEYHAGTWLPGKKVEKVISSEKKLHFSLNLL